MAYIKRRGSGSRLNVKTKKNFLPTSFKSPQSLRLIRERDTTAYLKSYTIDDFITPCLSPCFVEGCQQGKNSVALSNVAINFGYEYFCFVIYFSEIFFIKTFFQNLFPNFFLNFFSKFFFSKFFFPKFFFQLFFKIFFRELYSRCLPVYRDKTDSMYLCHEKYDLQQAVEIGLQSCLIRYFSSVHTVHITLDVKS